MSGFKAGDRVRITNIGGDVGHRWVGKVGRLVVKPDGYPWGLDGDDFPLLDGEFERVTCDEQSCYCPDPSDCPAGQTTSDDISNPSHYNAGRAIEPWTVIDDWQLDYYLGSALKYLARAGRKDDEVKDLRKLIAFVERRIELVKGAA